MPRDGALNENVWSELLCPNEKLKPLILLLTGFVIVFDDNDILGLGLGATLTFWLPIELSIGFPPTKFNEGIPTFIFTFELACTDPDIKDDFIGLLDVVKLTVLTD